MKRTNRSANAIHTRLDSNEQSLGGHSGIGNPPQLQIALNDSVPAVNRRSIAFRRIGNRKVWWNRISIGESLLAATKHGAGDDEWRVPTELDGLSNARGFYWQRWRRLLDSSERNFGRIAINWTPVAARIEKSFRSARCRSEWKTVQRQLPVLPLTTRVQQDVPKQRPAKEWWPPRTIKLPEKASDGAFHCGQQTSRSRFNVVLATFHDFKPLDSTGGHA